MYYFIMISSVLKLEELNNNKWLVLKVMNYQFNYQSIDKQRYQLRWITEMQVEKKLYYNIRNSASNL